MTGLRAMKLRRLKKLQSRKSSAFGRKLQRLLDLGWITPAVAQVLKQPGERERRTCEYLLYAGESAAKVRTER
jgi:hypothetical protein